MIEPIARIRIELQDIEPRIWRRVDVPLSSTLLALHELIQFAFRWTDSHLFEFEIGDRRYGQPEYDRYADERLYKAASIRLKTVVDRGIEQFLYVYDFGDDWRHDLFIEEIKPLHEIKYPFQASPRPRISFQEYMRLMNRSREQLQLPCPASRCHPYNR